MDENNQFDILLNPKINNYNDLEKLEEAINKIEDRTINVTTLLSFEKSNDGGSASTIDIRELRKAVALIEKLSGLENKKLDINVDIKGLTQELAEGLTVLKRLRPDIAIDESAILNQFDNLYNIYKREYEKLQGKLDPIVKKVANKDLLPREEEFKESVDSAKKSLGAMIKISKVVDQLADQYEFIASQDKILEIPSPDVVVGEFEKKYKKSLEYAYDFYKNTTNGYEDYFNKIVSVGNKGSTETALIASHTDDYNTAIKESERNSEKLLSSFEALKEVVRDMKAEVNKFQTAFMSTSQTILSPTSQIAGQIQNYIESINKNVKTMKTPFDKENITEGATLLKQVMNDYDKIKDKSVKVAIEVADNGIKALSDLLSSIDDKTYQINVQLNPTPDVAQFEKIAKYIHQIAQGLKKLDEVRPDTLSDHLNVKLNNQSKESNPDTTTSPPPPETPVDPDIINNLASIGTKLNSIYEKLNQTINVDFAEDSFLKSQLMHNDESVEPIYEESLTERIVDIQNRLEWTNDFIGEAIETKENTEQNDTQNDTTSLEVNNLLNTIIEAINNLASKFDSPIQVESVDNEQSVNEVFYKTQIAGLADSINKSIANANNKDNYADVVGKKLDDIIAQLGKTFKTEVTNFSTLVNSSGGLLTQAQLAQLMQLLQKNQPTIVNSGASKTQDNTVGGIENAAFDRQRASEISSVAKANYDLFESLDKYSKETNSQLPRTITGFNELREQMRVIYSNIEDVVKKINKANLSEEKRKELMEELEKQNKSFYNWHLKNKNDLDTLGSYGDSLPSSTIGNQNLAKNASSVEQEILEYRDTTKTFLENTRLLIKYYSDANIELTDEVNSKINKELNIAQSYYTNAESLARRIQQPNITPEALSKIEDDFWGQKDQRQEFLRWGQSLVVQGMRGQFSEIKPLILKASEAIEKLETLRDTIRQVEAAGGDTEGLKYLERRLEWISNFPQNPNLLKHSDLYSTIADRTFEAYDSAGLNLFNFDDSNIEIDDFSKKVQKLKKLLKQLRDSGGETQKILANIGNLDNNQLEALSNNFESRKNEYIVNAASAQGKDADFLKEQYFGNSIQPLIEYINRLDEVTEAVNNFTTAKKESNKATKEQEQADNAAIAFQKKYEETVKRLRKWGDDNSKALKDPYFAKAYEELTNRISMGAIQSDKDLNKLRADMSALDRTVKEAGVSGKTFGNVLGELYKKYGGWAFVTKSLNYTVRLLKDMVTQVHEVDTAMTDLKKVTDANERQLKQYLDTAGGRSVDIGATLTDYVDATSEFSRLGKSLNEAENLGKLATIYKTVGDDLDIQTASQSIISTMQAYEKIGVTAEEIVDKFNYTGNNFAITSKGVGDALQRSAAALNGAGNDLNESIALITAGKQHCLITQKCVLRINLIAGNPLEPCTTMDWKRFMIV